MRSFDVVVIGGGPAGIVAASTVKKTYSEKSVCLIRKSEKALIPCGIPYVFGTLKDGNKNIVPDKWAKNIGVEIIIDEAIDTSIKEKIIYLRKNQEIGYSKLILAIGSEPIMIPFPGRDLQGVFTIKKDFNLMSELQEEINKAENIVVVGGGFIGVEFADEIRKLGKNITIIEILPFLLGKAFDPEFGKEAEEELKKNEVKVLTSTKVKGFKGTKKVEKVILENDKEISADVVIISVGYRPNVRLAREAGIALGNTGAILVDEFMRTSAPDVIAVGDCAENRCYLTHKGICPMLASIATASARMGATNLFEIRVIRDIPGSVSVFSTKVGNKAFGCCGFTETMARNSGYDIVTGVSEGVDRHPASIPDVTKLFIKLITLKGVNKLLGAEVMGGVSTGEIINLLALALQKRMTAGELSTIQVGTHPMLTSPPTAYPVVIAALDAFSKDVSSR